jgi:hypothetical protein
MVRRFYPQLWLVLVIGTAGFLYSVKVPLLSNCIEIILLTGFACQAIFHGLPLTLVTVAVFTLLLVPAFRQVGPDVSLVAIGTYLCEVGLAGGLLGWAVSARKSFFSALLWGALPALIACGLLLANPYGLQDQVVRQIDQVEQLFMASAVTPTDAEAPAQQALLARSFAFFKQVFPAVNLVSTVLTLFVIYLVVAVLGRRLGFPVTPVPLLAVWQIPFFWVWVFAAGLAATLWGRPALVKITGYNMLVGTGFLFMLEGLAVLKHFFISRGVSVFVEYMTYAALVAALRFSPLALALVGLFDLWFDFRKINAPVPVQKA